jgi:hypothetical protein
MCNPDSGVALDRHHLYLTMAVKEDEADQKYCRYNIWPSEDAIAWLPVQVRA